MENEIVIVHSIYGRFPPESPTENSSMRIPEVQTNVAKSSCGFLRNYNKCLPVLFYYKRLVEQRFCLRNRALFKECVWLNETI